MLEGYYDDNYPKYNRRIRCFLERYKYNLKDKVDKVLKKTN